jgi:hypothetical protein
LHNQVGRADPRVTPGRTLHFGAKANVRVHGSLASLKGAATPFVTFIDVTVGPHPFRLMARERNDFPDLFVSCEERILKAFSIKPMSVFDHGHLHIEKATLAEFQITIPNVG